jgi:hypothetical protein
MSINIEKIKKKETMKTYYQWENSSRWNFKMSYFINCFNTDKFYWNVHEFLYDK